MTKSRLAHIALLLLTSFILSCGSKYKKDSPLVEVDSKNPNGDSELAIIMRAMMDHGKELKQQIIDSTELTPYPESFHDLTTAEPTEGMIEDRDIFNALANYHLSTLDSIYLDNVNKSEQFNHMVNSCVSCHQNYCQGPIPAIKKLYIIAQ